MSVLTDSIPQDDPPEHAQGQRLRHQLANPLAAVLAEAQLLLMGTSPLTPEVREGLEAIEAQAMRMRQILHASRQDAPPDQ